MLVTAYDCSDGNEVKVAERVHCGDLFGRLDGADLETIRRELNDTGRCWVGPEGWTGPGQPTMLLLTRD